MNLRSRNKVDPNFNMSSMTDLIFLLLIFFMLTSSFITPSALPVNLPTSRPAPLTQQKIAITVTEDLKYLIGDKEVSFENLKAELGRQLSGQAADENIVVVHADKNIKYDDVIKVVSVAAELNAKVSLATKPN